MGARISKALEIYTFLSWSLALIPLLTGSRPGRGSEARVERRTSSPPKTQNQTLTESGPQEPDDPQLKTVLDRMTAAGITRPSSVADVRKAYLFYPKLSGTPEHVFHIDDRQIPWPAGHLTDLVYPTNPTRGLAVVVTLMDRERSTPSLVVQILIYPMLDASTMRPSWFTESDAPTVTRESKHKLLSTYLPITANLGDSFISPIRAQNFKNLPPALLMTYGGHDPMRIEGEEYIRRLKADGVVAKASIYTQPIPGFLLMTEEAVAGITGLEG